MRSGSATITPATRLFADRGAATARGIAEVFGERGGSEERLAMLWLAGVYALGVTEAEE